MGPGAHRVFQDDPAQRDHAVELRGAGGPEQPGAVVEEGQHHVRAAGIACGGATGRAVFGRLVAALGVHGCCPGLQVGGGGARGAGAATVALAHVGHARAVEAEALAVVQLRGVGQGNSAWSRRALAHARLARAVIRRRTEHEQRGEGEQPTGPADRHHGQRLDDLER